MTNPDLGSSSDIPKESPRAILFQFVFFPLGVVLIGVAIFLLFGRLAGEEQTIRDHLGDIRNGSRHERWQAAYELSKSLKRGEAKAHPNLALDVIQVYNASRQDDPRVRQYLSIVLGKLGDRRATPVLLTAMSDQDVEARIYAVLALGMLKDPASVPELILAADDPEKDVRKAAIGALGEIGDKRALSVLARAAGDPTPDVRYNAAIALARMNDRRAVPPLKEMLDRERLDKVTEMRPDQKEWAMLAAISAWSALLGKEGEPELRQLAASDPSMHVRAAAKAALEGR
jgi:HEAT repeat protein